MDKLKEYMNFKTMDRTYWVLFLTLIVVAIIAISSAGSSFVYKSHSVLSPVAAQLVYFAIGIAAAFVIQFVRQEYILLGGYAALIVSLLCLYAIMIAPSAPFVATINGAARWIRVGGITFQPSEMAKLGLIIVIAHQLSLIRTEEDKRVYFFRTLIITAVTVLPIMIGNLSTAMLLSGIVLIMWFLARLPWKYILSVIGIGAVLLVVGYLFVEYRYVQPKRELEGRFSRAVTWVSRVDNMLKEHQNEDAKFELDGDNYQRSIAKVAVARGSTTPFGVFPGNSKERDFLPLAYADYIFAIIVEESGIIGALFLISIYLCVLFRACYTSSRFRDETSTLMVMGLALMITCQALVSMMVAVGIGPVTGQPLPIITRGGTSAVITSVYFGILMGVSRQQQEAANRQQHTIEESINETPKIDLEA